MSEKYLKAILQDLAQPIPRTHDLEILVQVLLTQYPALRKLIRRLRVLTPYAVEFRYPDESANRRQALAAVRHAETIRKELRTRLGLNV